MGITPIQWLEIDAYNRCNDNWLSQWDCAVIRQMSQAYCKWHAKGGRQGDLADDVPYIERNEETLTVMRERLIKMRESSDNN